MTLLHFFDTRLRCAWLCYDVQVGVRLLRLLQIILHFASTLNILLNSVRVRFLAKDAASSYVFYAWLPLRLNFFASLRRNAMLRLHKVFARLLAPAHRLPFEGVDDIRVAAPPLRWFFVRILQQVVVLHEFGNVLGKHCRYDTLR